MHMIETTIHFGILVSGCIVTGLIIQSLTALLTCKCNVHTAYSITDTKISNKIIIISLSGFLTKKEILNEV